MGNTTIKPISDQCCYTSSILRVYETSGIRFLHELCTRTSSVHSCVLERFLTALSHLVLAAVAQHGLALVSASVTLKADRGVVLAAVAQNGYALMHASEELKADREVLLAAVAQNGYALQFASELTMTADREVVLAAVAQTLEEKKAAAAAEEARMVQAEEEATAAAAVAAAEEVRRAEEVAAAVEAGELGEAVSMVGVQTAADRTAAARADTIDLADGSVEQAAVGSAPPPPGEPRTAAAASGPRAAAADQAAAAPAIVKEDKDGGWPAEFQLLRQLPFDQAEHDRLHGWFFTSYDVVAGVRESRTRRGTIRHAARITRQKVRIEEWPRLRQRVEELVARGGLTEALQHMRCLQAYMAAVRHASVPRILRPVPATGAALGSAIGETRFPTHCLPSQPPAPADSETCSRLSVVLQAWSRRRSTW